MRHQGHRSVRWLLGGVGCSILLLLSACPSLQPILSLDPAAVILSPTTGVGTFVIQNTGNGTLSYTLHEVSRPDVNSTWTRTEVSWFSVDSATGSLSRNEAQRITITASLSTLAAGTYTNVGIEIASNAGTRVVPVSLVLPSTLVVEPSELQLPEGTQRTAFFVRNTGSTAFSWNVFYLTDPNNSNSATPLPSSIRVTPSSGTTAPNDSTRVDVEWDAGTGNFALLVRSTAGEGTVHIRFVPPLETLEATPSPLILYVSPDRTQAPTGQLTLRNLTPDPATWTLSAESLTNVTAPAPLRIAPASGTLAGNASTEVDVAVSDAQNVLLGSGNYQLHLQSGGASLRIPVTVEERWFPQIELSRPPDITLEQPPIVPISSMDFGTDEIQMVFYVVNIGPLGSQLFFRITHDDEGRENPLLAEVTPLQGNTNGPDQDFFYQVPGALQPIGIDGVPIVVTIDRKALQQDVEYRDITVEAVESDFTTPVPGVEPKTMRIRVQRKPLTIEGAVNRSRPPYVARFVFLLRDSVGAVIPTRSEEDRARLQFFIRENDIPLDLNETSMFIRGPEDLKVNLVLMLDYTGSMYYAGTQLSENPLQPGEAVARVREAAKKFLDDLPPSYRVSLMFHNDRQQQNRIIYPFTTDRAALKQALDNFNVPPSFFGVSDIRDALVDAGNRLIAEDAGLLPFDDADVRAVLFITDGFDNASATRFTELKKFAHDNRIRMYPLAYDGGSGIQLADIAVLAEETGGHLYKARTVQGLLELLANTKGLGLENATHTAPNQATFEVVNEHPTESLTWSLSRQRNVPWLTVTPTSATLLAGQRATIQLTVNPSLLPTNTTDVEYLSLTSERGNGNVTVQVRSGSISGTLELFTLDLRDEPGLVWSELQNQIVLTYITPAQADITYNIRARYTPPDNRSVEGYFEDDAFFYGGDIRTGQIAMSTTGFVEDPLTPSPAGPWRAEVYVRADYVPRNVSQFRVRFLLSAPPGAPAAALAALPNVQMAVELAPDGLLTRYASSPWNLVNEGNGIYLLESTTNTPLAYGAFGNLLRLTFTHLTDYIEAFTALGQDPELLLELRLDNTLYYAPAGSTAPSRTVFFLYPGDKASPDTQLSIGLSSASAPTAPDVCYLLNRVPDGSGGCTTDTFIDPEAPGVWDRDSDGVNDFYDADPDNAAIQ